MYNEMMKGVKGREPLVEAGESLLEKLDAWESHVVEGRQKNTQDVINWPSKLNAEFFTLRRKIDTHDPRITKGVKDRMADLEAQWSGYQKAYNVLINKDMRAYNQMFRDQQVPALLVGESGGE
jgi:hypothetical protein